MNHPIDKIFREKLGDLEVQLPSDAWERVQQHRGKKNGSWKKWLSIAATLLIVISSYYIVKNDPLPQEAAIAKTETAIPTPDLQETETAIAPSEAAQIAAVETTKEPVAETKNVTSSEPARVAIVKAPAPVVSQVREMPEMVSKMTVVSVLPVEKSLPVKITLPELPDAEVSSSTLFDKIANTAREIKNHDGMMAELRELKDDVLSLEFFKTKKSI